MPAPVEISVTNAPVVRIDIAALAAYIRSPSSEPFRQISLAAEAVKQAAIRESPVSKHDPIPRRKPRTPGAMRAAIVKRQVSESGVPVFRVGPIGIKYAMYVHEGTRPHPILPARAPALVFWGNGHVVRTKLVNHPGNAPDRWLIRAAASVLGSSNVRSA